MQTSLILATVASAAAYGKTESFSAWAKKNGKTYSKEETSARRAVFAANVAKVNAHNSKGLSWTMGVNKFADLTADEFAARYAGGYRAKEKRSVNVANELKSNLSALPTSVDWEAAGAVTPIKDQGQCGSCWAFSTTGSTEGNVFIQTGKLLSLSEQQLVDCSGAEGNQGCNGGLMDYGFQFIIDNKGICSEASYPYTAADGTCQTTCKAVATITGFTDVPTNSQIALETAAVQQPVSVAVEADQDVFQFYTGGVMTSACGTALDHGVLVVGYGTDAANGGDYWKVKNSWGATWGEKGYIRLGRGATFNPDGQCGIQMDPSYPTGGATA